MSHFSPAENMILITHIVLFGLLNFSLGDDDCVIHSSTSEIIQEKQLIKDLRCGYNTNLSPKPTNSQNLTINTKLVLKYFSFSSDEEQLILHTWMFLSWTDERLKWDPDKYGGVKEVDLSSNRIWTPTLRLFNSADFYDLDRFRSVDCHLKSKGSVLCVPRVVHRARCSVKLKNFPYDVQECALEFGLWVERSEKLILNVSSRAISLWGAEYGSQWFISDYRQETKVDTERQLIMTLVLEREALSLAAVIVYPSLIISALTLTCIFVDLKSNIRLALVCFSIFSHYYWLVELGETLSKESADPPNLLLYYRGSLVLTMLLFLITFVLAIMSQKKSAPHNFVISINGFVFSSYARFLIFPLWDAECLVITDENKYNEDWIKFVSFINTACGIIIVIAYIGLYFSFMPQPVPFDY